MPTIETDTIELPDEVLPPRMIAEATVGYGVVGTKVGGVLRHRARIRRGVKRANLVSKGVVAVTLFTELTLGYYVGSFLAGVWL
ncbi:hypothetical protein [Agromyces sp. SYSU T00194]|uniref:hypothetical protein n=1 Tax=Agromyces chitinivorans TaxID=3158560 RepID=UPI0033952776